MRRAWMFIAMALLAEPLAWAAKPVDLVVPKAKLDAYFDALGKQGLANGAIAIWQRGTLRYERVVGFSALGITGPEATDAGTRYRIGVLSKLFTAVLTMQLVESASIGLDSKLAEFFPELPNSLDITYRDLLQNRSGLANYLEAPELPRLLEQPEPDWRAIVKIIETSPARFAPRERVEDNPSNYLLLSLILEKVYEKPYADIVRRQIADRIGLARTYERSHEKHRSLESRAYQFGGGAWKEVPIADTDPRLAVDNLVSTPGDLARFMDALFAGKLVTLQSLATLRGADAPHMGLAPWTAAGRTGFGLEAKADGFAAWVWHLPETGTSIAFASNAERLPVEEIVDEVIALIFERGRKPPTFEPVVLGAAQQRGYVGTWRTTSEIPAQLPFRNVATPETAEEMVVAIENGRLVARERDATLALVALGGDEFMAEGAPVFVRFFPRSNAAVVRSPEKSVYLERAADDVKPAR